MDCACKSSGERRSWAMSVQACREAGISRALFYRWRQRLERYGAKTASIRVGTRAPAAAGRCSCRRRPNACC